MKYVRIEKCPFCGGEEFIDGQITSYGGVAIATGGIRSAELYGTVCRNCGSVVRIFCQDPEKLYPKKERRY